MKKVVSGMMALFTLTLIIGCAGAPKVKVPKEVPTPTPKQQYELEDLYLTTDANQMSGTPIDHAKLGVGETIVIYARGMSSIETGGKWFKLPDDVVVNWKADPELEVTPTTGHEVTVKVIKPISGAAYVTATTTTKDGKKIEKTFTVTGK